ncbi:unnamed protein product [Meganyctiphanes norvegica]|uniref:Uncharacterized protein n=1 Tax=Meganyctiphanes norvegica TaxID=48144 RepID=A0AAV2Q8L4_MEGNR
MGTQTQPSHFTRSLYTKIATHSQYWDITPLQVKMAKVNTGNSLYPLVKFVRPDDQLLYPNFRPTTEAAPSTDSTHSPLSPVSYPIGIASPAHSSRSSSPAHNTSSSPLSTSSQKSSVSVPSAHPSPPLSPQTPPQQTPPITPPPHSSPITLTPSPPSMNTTQNITEEFGKLAISNTSYRSRDTSHSSQRRTLRSTTPTTMTREGSGHPPFHHHPAKLQSFQ